MGEVYRAIDTYLHRDVALKILPESVAGDAAAEARFEREARVIASVSHPNICAVYDVGIDAGRRFLVMELLDGETLQERLRRGPLALPDLLEWAITLADALHTAHSRDVIHRDLKPANIFVTGRGELKILDFGLAKVIDAADGETRAADQEITARGATVGTAAYMSPEQIRGESLDARTDLFSLGLVLFEMATGQRPFAGNTGAAVAASTLRDRVTRPGALRPGLSADLDTLILKALEKDRDLRYQGAADLRADLKRLKRQLTSATESTPLGDRGHRPGDADDARDVLSSTPSSSSSDGQLLAAILRRHRGSTVLVGVAVLSVAVAGWLWLNRRDPGSPAAAFANVKIQPLTLDGRARLGAISPDGRFLVYQAYGDWGIRVRQIAAATDVPVVAAKRFSRTSSLTVTPDSDFVDVVAVTGTERLPDLWRIPLLGGERRLMFRGVVSAIGWSRDGRTMAFVRSHVAGEMTVVLANADGSNARDLVTRRTPKMFFGDLTIGRPGSRPDWSPDGSSLVMAAYTAGELESTELVILDATTGQERGSVTMRGNWPEVAWMDDNRFLLLGKERAPAIGTSGFWVSDVSGKQLTRLTSEFAFFSHLSVTADRSTAIASKFSRLSGISVSGASGADTRIVIAASAAGAAQPVLDLAGGLTYTAFTAEGDAAIYRLPPEATSPIKIVDQTALPFAARLYDVSADGRTLIYAQFGPPHALIRVEHDRSEQVTLVESDVAEPRLTPDGQTVLFTRVASAGLYSVAAGGGPVHRLTDQVIPPPPNAARNNAFSISPDGKRLLLSSDKPGVVGTLRFAWLH